MSAKKFICSKWYRKQKSVLRISESQQLIQQLTKYCSHYPLTIITLLSNTKHNQSAVQ